MKEINWEEIHYQVHKLRHLKIKTNTSVTYCFNLKSPEDDFLYRFKNIINSIPYGKTKD